MIQKQFDKIKHRVRSDPFREWEPAEFKEFNRRMENIQSSFSALQKLAEREAIDIWFLPSVMEYLKAQNSDTESAISDGFESIIKRYDDFTVIENVAIAWSNLSPQTAGRKLRRLYLESTDPQIKENAKRALIILGEDIVGDTFNITNAGIVNIKSTLNNTTQTINNSPNIDQPTKKELEELIERLNIELEKTPQENAKDAESVAKRAKMLIDAADEEEPDKELVEITADRLLKAAQNIAKVIPVVVPIAKQIIALLVN